MGAALQLVRDRNDDSELAELDQAIDMADEQQANAFQVATLARWEFGKLVATAKGGKKKLPNGRMAALTELTGKSSQEINYRIQFAEKVTTEDQFSNALENHDSWRELVKSFAKPKDEAEESDAQDQEPQPEPDAKPEPEPMLEPELAAKYCKEISNRIMKLSQMDPEGKVLRAGVRSLVSEITALERWMDGNP